MLCLDTRLGCLSRSVNYDSDAAIVITAAKDLFSAYQKLYYGLPLWKFFSTAAYRSYQRAEETLYEYVAVRKLIFLSKYSSHQFVLMKIFFACNCHLFMTTNQLKKYKAHCGNQNRVFLNRMKKEIKMECFRLA